MLRSLLFVPAQKKMLGKICSLHPDGYIIDLEDSIKDGEKESALNLLCGFLSENLNLPNIYVRLNKFFYDREVELLKQYNIGFMLPKFENLEDYASFEDVWCQHRIIALIETPLGVVNIHEISRCPWVDAIAFGAEDFTASMNMQNEDELLLPIKLSLITNAKAYNKKIFDTPSFKLSETDEFEKDVARSVSLGFDGKLLINPRQIECVNYLFGEVDIDRLKYIVTEYDRIGKAVAVIDNTVYEKMHINRYRRIIEENKRIGL